MIAFSGLCKARCDHPEQSEGSSGEQLKAWPRIDADRHGSEIVRENP
jgi:hypothetical protein